MHESGLHSHIYARSAGVTGRFPQVQAGPGDDCAVLAGPVGRRVLATVDHLIEGRHYEGPAGRATGFDAIARKAVARSVSDIAAMGGSLHEWSAALATAALPHGFPQRDADELFDRLQFWCEHWRCPLVGGDAAAFGGGACAGPLTLTVTVLGLAHAARGPVLRSGARPGDGVFVTGALGGSLRSGRHLTFEPRLREAGELCELLGGDLRAMLDISDGLGRDGARLAAASGVSIELDAAMIPCHAGCAWREALRDGEDYELVFTAASGAPVPARCADTPITRIGSVAAGGPRCAVRGLDGSVHDASNEGWDHS